jgi:UDP-N-acetylmuramoylalanine--D-glutamate ligase
LPWSNTDTLARARAAFQGKRGIVVGLAREGLDLTRFLVGVGAQVLVTDRKSADQLGMGLSQLADLPVAYHLGSDPVDELPRTDVVFASPGVPLDHPFLQTARERGIRVSSLIEVLFELCPAPVVGITGSAGKTTTTTLLGEIFRLAGRDVFVGGNIGKPLLGELGHMTPQSWAVLELSSFQLEPLRQSPHIAAITNVTPNHLDRHPSMEAYWAAKGQILANQATTDWAVLNADDAWSGRYRPRGRVLRFSLEGTVEGAYLADSHLMLFGDPVLAVQEVPLRGRHNLANALAAIATAHAAGIERDAMRAAIRGFAGVPHRLELVGERDGVRFINDSIATAPERSIAALRAFDEPIVLIAGGRDKHLPMEEWARLIVRRVKHVVLLGEMSDLIADALNRADASYSAISRAESMDEAVQHTSRVAKDGDVVLLSPGGTSFDRYGDFEERGADFRRAVRWLGADAAQTTAAGVS